MSIENFRSAYFDFKLFKEKGYPEKASIKLVGDRYRLTRTERNSLFRGVIVDSIADARKRKIIGPSGAAGLRLGVDWYNVLITVESYLRGVPLFIADDGILRDSAATHGSYRRTAATDKAFPVILDALGALRPERVDVFLDSPIAFSGMMAEEIRGRLEDRPFAAEVALARSADFPLKTYRGIVASSDSVILDRAERILDLPRLALEAAFGFTPPLLRDLGSASPSGPARSSGTESPGS
jgi:hypothetical protein